jgi:3-methyl-2-oxobutanoate hydroxymethyltransferase
LQNAGRFLQEAGADAVKIEGGEMRVPLIKALVANGIPVLGHIGLTPQSVKEMGYKVQGRAAAEADRLLADAKALAAAGVFAVVLECVPPEVGARISEALSIPTIGIGAGAGCDGQVLVFTDLVGYNEKVPSFVKQYAQVGQQISAALSAYKTEVESGTYPSDDHTY